MTRDPAMLAHLRHELRTPLNHIIGYSEMLLEDVAHDEHAEFAPSLRRILDDARQLLALINDVLVPAESGDATRCHERLPETLLAPSDDIVAISASLMKLAVERGASGLLADLERVVIAANYLSDAVRHGVAPPPPPAAANAASRDVSGDAAAEMLGSPAPRGAILVVDDNGSTREMLLLRLARGGYTDVASAADGREALDLLSSRKFDLVLLDVIMPGLDGFAVCERLRSQDATRDIPIIFLTALDATFDKVRAFSAGAVDYVTKPFQPQELLARVGTHLSLLQTRRRLEEQNARLREEIEAHLRSKATIQCLVEEIQTTHNFGELVGESQALRRVLADAELVAATDSTVLIQGETGTGKELIARAIHGRGARRERPLIKVNCAALPRDLVESELFGHEKGAFTGATQQRRGRFELADGGTVFLDEIAELPLESQAKLLRVLQEQEFERVGGTRTLRIDVRVMAASNRDLQQRVATNVFRADLFYRLNVFPLTLPPLRERREDIPRLIRHFMNRAARKVGKRFDDIAPGFVDQAMAYDWPGNVRELENFVERAAIISRGPILESGGVFTPAPESSAFAVASAKLEDVERTHILRVLEQTHWSIEGERGAASMLGLNPSTLRGRMRKLGLQKKA